MDNYLYSCQYCGKEYIPNRRYKQKFCCNSCRTNNHKRNKKNNLLVKSEQATENNKPLQVEKMSLAGVGNAAAGTLAINLVTKLLTPESQKPVTKMDLKNLINTLQVRYHPVLNMQPNLYGNKAFYDLETKTVVYLNKIQNHGIK